MIDRLHFYKTYREKFGKLKQEQVNGLNFLLQKLDDSKVFSLANEYAYILSTVKHETADTYKPITEYGSQKYLTSKPYYPYIGRGYVQLTWKINYKIFEDILNVPLVKNPDLAKDPETAWQVLEIGMSKGLFTGVKLSKYVNESVTDYKNARRVINGTDQSNLLMHYANDLYSCIEFSDTQYSQAEIDNINLS